MSWIPPKVRDGTLHCQPGQLRAASDHVDGVPVRSEPPSTGEVAAQLERTAFGHAAAQRDAARATTGPTFGKLEIQFVPMHELLPPTHDALGRELSGSMSGPPVSMAQRLAAIEALRAAGFDVTLKLGYFGSENLSVPAKGAASSLAGWLASGATDYTA